MTSHTTSTQGTTQPGAASSQCSVGQFLPPATQQRLGTAALAPPGSNQEAGKAGKLTCASGAASHNASIPHLPLDLVCKLCLPSLLFWGQDQPSSLSAILSLFPSPCSLLWQLPSWEEGLHCHLVSFVPRMCMDSAPWCLLVIDIILVVAGLVFSCFSS